MKKSKEENEHGFYAHVPDPLLGEIWSPGALPNDEDPWSRTTHGTIHFFVHQDKTMFMKTPGS